MVEAVTEPRGRLCGGHGGFRNSGALRQEYQQRGRSLCAPGRTTRGKERLPQGLAGWQLFAACSGVFEAAGFSRGCGTLLLSP